MILLFLSIYLLLQLGIGYWASRKIQTESDYLLAGRSLGIWLTTFGIFATWFGAETCIGAAGRIYEFGLSGGSADPFGYAFCILLMGLLLAVPIWRMKLTTLGDLFRIKFGNDVEKLASLIMIPTSLLWSAAQIRGLGVILSAVSGWNLEVMITIAALIVLLYTMLGGLLADSISDLIQGSLLIVGLTFLFSIIFVQHGFDPISRLGPDRLMLADFSSGGLLKTLESWSIPVIGSLAAVELITRAMAAKTEKVARRGAINAFFIYLGIGMVPVYIGLIGPEIMPGLERSEQIIPELAKAYMSPIIYAIFSGALISAILSTVDSALLASGSLFSHNILLRIYPSDNQRKALILTRLTVLIFGVFAFIMAMYADGVYSLVEEASAFGSAGITVCVLFAARSNIGNRYGAISSLLGGVFSYIIFEYSIAFPYPFLGSLGIALVLYILISRLTLKQMTTN